MEAINRPNLSALAGAVLGLCVGLALLAMGALNALYAGLAILAFAALVFLLVPTTSSRPASGVGDRSADAHDSASLELDRWLASRVAMGCSIYPTDVLTAEAARDLGRHIRREQLVAAWERLRASEAVRIIDGAIA